MPKTRSKTKKLSTTGVPTAEAERAAGDLVDNLLARSDAQAERVADVHPVGGGKSRAWDTSKGRTWVVVAFWGTETTVSFYSDEAGANEAYEEATTYGADAFYGKTVRMMIQADEHRGGNK